MSALRNSLRRGWYVEGESFRKELLCRIDKQSSGSQQGSRPGSGAHHQRRAEEMLARGLSLLGNLFHKYTNAPKLFSRCEATSGIAPFDRLVDRFWAKALRQEAARTRPEEPWIIVC